MATKKKTDEPAEPRGNSPEVPEPAPEPEHVATWREALAAKWHKERKG
jgi:hypothetical protein